MYRGIRTTGPTSLMNSTNSRQMFPSSAPTPVLNRSLLQFLPRVCFPPGLLAPHQCSPHCQLQSPALFPGLMFSLTPASSPLWVSHHLVCLLLVSLLWVSLLLVCLLLVCLLLVCLLQGSSRASGPSPILQFPPSRSLDQHRTTPALEQFRL